jgi:hypothetical protein
MTDIKFFNPLSEIKIKRIISRVCPDCRGLFRRSDNGYECVGCGLELDEKGKPLPVFYGTVTIHD